MANLLLATRRKKCFFAESVDGTIRLIAQQVEGAVLAGQQVTVSIDGLLDASRQQQLTWA